MGTSWQKAKGVSAKAGGLGGGGRKKKGGLPMNCSFVALYRDERAGSADAAVDVTTALERP